MHMIFIKALKYQTRDQSYFIKKVYVYKDLYQVCMTHWYRGKLLQYLQKGAISNSSFYTQIYIHL